MRQMRRIVGAIYLLQRNHNIFNFFRLHRGDIVGKVIEVIDRAVLGIQPYLNEQILHVALELIPVFFYLNILIMNKILQILVVMVDKNKQRFNEVRPDELKFTLLVLEVFVQRVDVY